MTVRFDSTVSGVAANSYVTLAFANSHHEEQLHNSDWFDTPQETLAKALIAATEYIDLFDYKGYATVSDQFLKFPRTGMIISGRYAPSTVVPIQVRKATAQLALAYIREDVGDGSTSQAGSITGAVSKIKAGPVQIDYAGSGAVVSSGQDVRFLTDLVYRFLRPFLANVSNSGRVRV